VNKKLGLKIFKRMHYPTEMAVGKRIILKKNLPRAGCKKCDPHISDRGMEPQRFTLNKYP